MKQDYSGYRRITNLELEDAIAEYNMMHTEEAYAELDILVSDWIHQGGALLVPVYIGGIESPIRDCDDEPQLFCYKVLSYTIDDKEWIIAYTSVDAADKDLGYAFFLQSLEELGITALEDDTFSGVVINPEYDPLFLDRDYFKRHLPKTDKNDIGN